ncbi:MAG: aminoglycoside phosphotransferase family protein [Anaerolineaceae bacterium]|nr:aminoglycoside phosphotransferase family protein [Anaerolineaceae bacterium]
MKSDPTLSHIAAEIFATHGIDFATARRAGGWTNANWIAGGLVLRLSTVPGRDGLRREAKLGRRLPSEVGYPSLVDLGVREGYEWTLAQEVPGRCLGETWPELSWDERIMAFEQLWEIAQAVHRSPPAALQLARERAWFNSTDPAEAEAGISRVTAQRLFTYRQAGALRAILSRFWQALPGAGHVLNHGDLTLDNAIWHEGRVVSLLDFEYAVRAPVELDLNTMLKVARQPHSDIFPEPGAAALLQAAERLSAPLLARPGGQERLLGYSVLLELWLLEDWLAHPEGEGPLETWDPYRRLLALGDE